MRGTTLPISAQLVRPVAHDDRWHHLFEISAGDAASDVGKKGCTSYTEVLQNYFTFKHHMNNRQTLIFQLSFDHLWWAVPNSSDVMEILTEPRIPCAVCWTPRRRLILHPFRSSRFHTDCSGQVGSRCLEVAKGWEDEVQQRRWWRWP